MSQANIILILADDMGFSDIGCFGSEIATPNLDRLAANGARFSQMYSFARCCPSRAALLTGLYPHQAGVGHMVSNRGARAYQGYLRDDAVTIAEVLRGAGYRTLMSGKWHTGGEYAARYRDDWRPGAPGYPTPLDRGFDQFFGTLAGAGSFFHPHALMADGELVDEHRDGFYYTDDITDQAIAMIDDARRDNLPFFLHVAYTAPHWPLHALPEDIAKYEGVYRAGWDRLRQQRHEELNSLGILDPVWRISPRDEDSHPWTEERHSDWEDLRMATYAAMIDRMDQGIGRILAKLDEQAITDNTLIIFLSDNGGCAEYLAEDGWINSYVPALPDGRPVRIGNRRDLLPGPADTYMSYDLPWANASNSPFRLYKHWVHEGGISSPCIARFPAQVDAGTLVHSPVQFIDVLPTFAELAGAKYPTEYGGQAIQPVEGESFLPALQGSDWQRENPLYWEHEGNRALRIGDWKLVSKHPGPWELYNMIEDRTELNDLAASEKERVRNMSASYAAWARRCEVRDWPLD
ncbi:MAG: arylsulfatase [Chloroflexota bacterium]|nr:arylsulfatase [Chloroflexota bacterium]